MAAENNAEAVAIQIKPSSVGSWKNNGEGWIGGRPGGMSYLTVECTVEDRFSIAFSARLLEGTAAGTHFGVDFDCNANRLLRLYSWMNRLNCQETEGSKDLQHIVINHYSEALVAGREAVFSAFRIEYSNGKGEIFRDGNYAGTFESKPGAVKQIRLYVWNGSVEFKEIVVKKLPPPPVTEIRKSTDPRPVFEAAFDGNTDALDAQTGKPRKPVLAENIVYVPGIHGQGIHITSAPQSRLQYDAKDIFDRESGTVMFWFKPDWDGLAQDGTHSCIAGIDAGSTPFLNIFINHYLNAKLRKTPNVDIWLDRYSRRYLFAGEWIHVALTWNANGWNKLFLNGAKYQHGQFPGPTFPVKGMPMLQGIEKLLVGTSPDFTAGIKNADGVFDDLKIYNMPVSDEEIAKEYQKSFPVALMLEQRFVPADRAARMVLRVEPLSYIGIKLAPRSGSSEMGVTLNAADGNQEVFKTSAKIVYGEAQEVALELPPLKPGIYHLKCNPDHENPDLVRVFRIMVYNPPGEQKPGDKLSTASGPSLPEIDFTKIEPDKIISNVATKAVHAGLDYLQAGSRKGDRFAVKLHFPDELIQAHRPVVLDIRWPDDRPRSAGFYMYVKTHSAQHRDRLEGGIQSGEEFPPMTHKIQTTSYLFYPGVNDYLFEARTMSEGKPAAVASLSVREVTERYPRLNIKYPKGFQPRALGHMDEDQSFELITNHDDASEINSPFYPVKLFNRICEYFAYTGQSVIAYPILRYFYVSYDLPGQMDSVDVRHVGWINLFLDLLQSYRMKLIGTVNLSSMPEFRLPQDDLDRLKSEGCFLRDKAGKFVAGGTVPEVTSPVHPAVRQAFLNHIEAVVKRFGSHPAFGGLDLWVKSTWTYESIDQGYDDFAVNLFARESGIALPVMEGPDRFSRRFELLTGQYRKEWLKWRSDKTMEMVRAVRALMDKSNPHLKLYVNFQALNPVDFHFVDNPEHLDFDRYCYEANGVVLTVAKAMASTVVVPNRNPTRYRWYQHWSDSPSLMEELTYDRSKYLPFLNNGSTSVWASNTYFETWNNSLLPKEYASYFQNADVKPQGRHFLKEYAFDVAAMDADMILCGAQPIGTLGREEEIQEFAKAFCALPAVPFTPVERLADPVAARYLKTPNGTYFYFVNLLWSDVDVAVKCEGKCLITNLSTGEKVELPNNKLTVHLRPYQLCSFLAESGGPDFSTAKVEVPDAVPEWYKENLRVFDGAEKTIKEFISPSAAFNEKLARVREAVAKGHYLDAHRLLYSKELTEVRRKLSTGDQSVFRKQAEMIKGGHYAIRCGSSEFFQCPDGRLFFPDAPYTEGSYGYVGNYEKTVRSIDNLNTPVPELFKTEAYAIDGYRFTVPNGVYSVKLYMKIGFPGSLAPGVVVFDININGKPAAKQMDLFKESGSNSRDVLIKEFRDINVSDGKLDINFFAPDGKDPTVKLCDAIEIIPQSKNAKTSGN